MATLIMKSEKRRGDIMAKILKRPATAWENLPPILDTPAVAMLLGLSLQVVRSMARSGKIPAFKVGKRIWRFEKAALMEFAGAKTKE